MPCKDMLMRLGVKEKSFFIQPLLLLCTAPIWFGGCEQKQNEQSVDGAKIFGEPIQEPLKTFASQGNGVKQPSLEDANSTHLIDSKINHESNVTTGFVRNGKSISNETNESSLDKGASMLPPLDGKGIYKPVAFRDLSGFKYEVNWEEDGKDFDFSAYANRVPPNIRSLSEIKVAIEGFMIPTVVDENNEVKEFLLLPDQMSCCFGQTPEANGWIVVSAEGGVEVMMDRIIRVTGTMQVEERWDEEFFVGLYHMSCDDITGPAL